MIRVHLIKMERLRCLRCGRTMRILVGGGDKADSCDCGCTSFGIKEGRPVGPRSKLWSHLCEVLGIDPETGLTDVQDHGDDEVNGWYYEFERVEEAQP